MIFTGPPTQIIPEVQDSGTDRLAIAAVPYPQQCQHDSGCKTHPGTPFPQLPLGGAGPNNLQAGALTGTPVDLATGFVKSQHVRIFFNQGVNNSPISQFKENMISKQNYCFYWQQYKLRSSHMSYKTNQIFFKRFLHYNIFPLTLNGPTETPHCLFL